MSLESSDAYWTLRTHGFGPEAAKKFATKLDNFELLPVHRPPYELSLATVVIERLRSEEARVVEPWKRVYDLPPASREHDQLWEADPNCVHNIEAQWSGVKCSKCRGWYCI